MYSRYDNDESGAGTAVLLVIGAIVGLIVLGLAGWGLTVWLSPMFGAGNAYKKTETADYRIANYEQFKTDCNAIVSLDAKIGVADEALSNGRKDHVGALRIQQLEGNVQALMNQRIELATEYNANASMSKTKDKFRDAGLPEYINPNEITIGVLSCS